MSPGSQTFEQALFKLFMDGKITQDEAMANADSATNMLWLINQATAGEITGQSGSRPASRRRRSRRRRGEEGRPPVRRRRRLLRQLQDRHECLSRGQARSSSPRSSSRASRSPPKTGAARTSSPSGSPRAGFQLRADELRRRHQPLGAARHGTARWSASPATPTWCRPARSPSGTPIPSCRRPRRQALRPRRRGHEVLDRRLRGRRRSVRQGTARPRGLDRPAAHLRRGRPGGRRHGAAWSKRCKQRSERHRLLHRRRADLGRRARRHDQERPARLALRQADGARRPGPRRLSAPRARTRSTCSPRRSPSWRRRSGTRATRTSRRPASRSRTSMPAPARPTWSPGRWRSTSTSASPPRAPTRRSSSGSKRS